MKMIAYSIPFLTTATAALAHPGAHDHKMQEGGIVDHLLSSPFHMALIIPAALLLIYGIHQLRKTLKADPIKLSDR